MTTEAESFGYEVAIIGMSGRFGAAASLDTLWQVLASGRSLVEEVPRSRIALSPRLS